MPRQLARQRTTLSDLEWPFHASRVISAVAELVVHSLFTLSVTFLQLTYQMTLLTTLGDLQETFEITFTISSLIS